MLTAPQLARFYPDLRDPLMKSAMAIVHSRFSTNTFPSWGLAHPHRMSAHNGEINTLQGNINWMQAREAILRSELFGADLARCLPLVTPGHLGLARVRPRLRAPLPRGPLAAPRGDDDDPARSREP